MSGERRENEAQDRGTMIDYRELGPIARLENIFVFTILGMKIVLFQPFTQKTLKISDFTICTVETGQQTAILTKQNPAFRLQNVIFGLFGQFGGFSNFPLTHESWNGINKISWSFYEEKMTNFGFWFALLIN